MKPRAAVAALKYLLWPVTSYRYALSVMNRPVVIALTESSVAVVVQNTPPTVDWDEQVEDQEKDLPFPDVPVIWYCATLAQEFSAQPRATVLA